MTDNDNGSRTKRLKRHFGGAVSGDQFWPRPEIVDNLVNTIKDGESVSLFGLRRIGKSSAMAEAARIISQGKDANKYTIVEIDAQDYNALDKLLTEILVAVPSDSNLFTSLKKRLIGNRMFPEAVKKGLELILNMGGSDADFSKSLPNYWGPVCAEIIKAIEESGTQLILMIDEFPYMCKNLLAKEGGRDFVDNLLATFRNWRQGPVTMVMSGSIGMQFLIREHQLEFLHFNDCFAVDIPPLASRAEAKAMLDALVQSTEVDNWLEETSETLLDEVTVYYPSFLQHAFSRLKAANVRSRPQIEEHFAEHIRPAWDSTFFDQFDIRLKVYDEVLRDLSRAVFAQMADDKHVLRDDLAAAITTTQQEQLTEALKILKEDGFLSRRAARDGSESWRFCSPLVETWWQQRQSKKVKK
ncbi:MAG: hypothetical protein HRT35_23185 [Algicola sp.]|nr:hypothetical protein [Algicola sp.]